ncbi:MULTISPECIES: YciI family protein [unclassified Streptomyces]|uniref:YciI family protein n=1 Tax=unclassified Streptomyces TaxID=2593676 RepID=UPI00225A04FC|nr:MULTISPECIES: YciI family protein [unclassified Streptomyces]MCX5054314.1 YciI family protein [Streptomyces sp. NBC_00474]
MFVLELTYTAPLDAVDALLEAHVAWLNEQFDKGVFLAAGRKVPRDGGIILALVEDRARAEEITAGDPFSTGGVCTYRIIEFEATRTAPALEQYRATSG